MPSRTGYRITSYNVCYTKLLRLVLPSRESSPTRGPRIAPRTRGWFSARARVLFSRYSADWVKSRITSYNVCYTKLLRTSLEKNGQLESVQCVLLNITVYAVADQFRRPVLSGRDDRKTTSHRLQTDIGERIVKGRQDQEVAGAVVLLDLPGRANDMQPCRQPEAGRQLVYGGGPAAADNSYNFV